MNIRAMYFSGTGTTKKMTAAIADELAKALAAEDFPGGKLSGETAGGGNDQKGSLEDIAGTENARSETIQAETRDVNFSNESSRVEASEVPAAASGKPLAAGTETWQRAADIDFTPPAARRGNYQFTSDDLVVFGVPVIAGRVPNVLLKFLDTIQGGDALAVPVVLYGNRNFDDALIELRNILQDHGFHAIAAAAFIGEHSFSRILGAGRPDSSDMELSRDFARKLAGKIRRHGAAALWKAAPVPVDGHDPIRPYYKPQDRNGNHINILKVKPKLHAELCSGCGICTTVCPMGSIIQEKSGQAPAPITGICIKCCGCVKKCPNGAFYFDDPGFLYHKEELEDMYAAIRREPDLYL